ncbi:MAG: hypothetical protein ACTSPD_18050 [Promethearchaeota archaeon]
MIDLSNDMRILIFLNDNGPQKFSELVNSKKLNLSRNTVNKYLRLLRDNNLVETKYENDRKLNFITAKGKIEVENMLGKDDIVHRLRAYKLVEEKIKSCRNEFLKRFGNMPNSLLMDCVENFLEFEKYNFNSRLPSEDFQYHLAYFLGRFDLQYCKSINWLRIQPDVVQLMQDGFCNQFKVNKAELKYFYQEWSKIKTIWPIYDKNDRLWFLSSKSFMYTLLMEQIIYRVRRGSLQEIVFENFIFNSADEAAFILRDLIKGWHLNLDLSQQIQIQSFILRMMNIFLEKKKGYSPPWLALPSNPEELMTLSINLETELKEVKDDSIRKSEIIRTLHYINAHLKNNEEAIYWGEKYLELNPKDIGMQTIMAGYYFIEKQYPNFLKYAKKIREQFGYDLIVSNKLIEYYLEIDVDLTRAIELIEETEKQIINNQNLLQFYGDILTFKAQAFFMQDNLKDALIYAQKAWIEYGERSKKLYQLIVEIYKKMEEWEMLEDFCLDVYYEDEYNQEIYPALYFAHLKRQSYNKASELYERTKRNFPDYIKILDDIKNKLK